MMDQNGMTPLMWAAYRTHRCVCLHVDVHAFFSLLQIVNNNINYFAFSVDPTRLLLTFNVSVNLGDKYHKNTALHWAVLAGNTTVISLLLEANANVDAQNIKVHTRLTVFLEPGSSFVDFIRDIIIWCLYMFLCVLARERQRWTWPNREKMCG